jgi:hypothetical protein
VDPNSTEFSPIQPAIAHNAAPVSGIQTSWTGDYATPAMAESNAADHALGNRGQARGHFTFGLSL